MYSIVLNGDSLLNKQQQSIEIKLFLDLLNAGFKRFKPYHLLKRAPPVVRQSVPGRTPR